MSEDRKTYVTTGRAGFVVAGRRVPAVYDEQTGEARPTIGHELQLLDKEAEYELAQGTIELRPASATAKKAVEKAASKDV